MKKKSTGYLLLFLLMLFLGTVAFFAFAPHETNAVGSPVAGISAEKRAFSSISPADAGKLVAGRQDLVFLDVRTPQELKSEGAIQGSVLVPFWAVMQNKLTIPRDKPILLVCAVGGRSYAAGQMLVRHGYQEVYNLSGGIDAWKKQGLPVVH